MRPVKSPGRIVPCETSNARARKCDQLEPRARFQLIAFRSRARGRHAPSRHSHPQQRSRTVAVLGCHPQYGTNPYGSGVYMLVSMSLCPDMRAWPAWTPRASKMNAVPAGAVNVTGLVVFVAIERHPRAAGGSAGKELGGEVLVEAKARLVSMICAAQIDCRRRVLRYVGQIEEHFQARLPMVPMRNIRAVLIALPVFDRCGPRPDVHPVAIDRSGHRKHIVARRSPRQIGVWSATSSAAMPSLRSDA